MDEIATLLHEARIQADENRSKDFRHFASSVVDCVEDLRQQLASADESNKAVERALKDVDYRGSYADGVLHLKQQLAAALAACDEQAAHNHEMYSFLNGLLSCSDCKLCSDAENWILSLQHRKPDTSALKAHDEALIERCAEVCEEYQGSAETCANAIRELKRNLEYDSTSR